MTRGLDDRAVLLTAQQRSMAAGRVWRCGNDYAALTAAFDAVVVDDAQAVAAVAERLLSRRDFIAGLLDPLIAALAQDYWFEPPFRVSRDALRTGAVLFEHPAVAISASVLSATALSALPDPNSVAVSGRLSVVRYVQGGGARLRRWMAEPADPDFSSAAARPLEPLDEIALSDGMVLQIDGRRQATQIIGARSDVVTITATIRAGVSPFQREYAQESGRLLRVATTDDGAARAQMLLTYLRHARRIDAAPWFDAATRDGAFFLRWAAMREWLALDVAAALPRLREMTCDGNAEVGAAALQTLPLAEAACRC